MTAKETKTTKAKSEESPRRIARELILKGLYAAEIGESETDYLLNTVLNDPELSNKNKDFAKQFFLLVQEHASWADESISGLSANWDIDRLAAIDRIILRMALVELKHMPDIPVKVAINEAIELGKKYSTAGSAAFINGILDSFASKMSKEDS